MGVSFQLWSRIWRLVTPEVEAGRVDRILAEAKSRLPTPVFWLLGKVQQGKTSIVRGLTGASEAEIGHGFRACTKTSAMYSFPDEDECFLKFLDTRGLGETHYDPGEDLQVLPEQAHCLLVVMKAHDPEQSEVLAALAGIHRARPRWPIVVCQTTLHDFYPPELRRHPQPYAFDRFPYPPEVPFELARALAVQRELFADYEAQFVPLDFTYPRPHQTVYEPGDYGLDALWQAIETAVPLGLREMVLRDAASRKRLYAAYYRAALPQVLAHAVAAGGGACIPIPFVDVPVVLAMQAKMFHSIASIYRQPMGIGQMATLASALGLGYLGRFGLREMLKTVPILGSTVSATYAAASTCALGFALCEYYSRVLDGDVPDARHFRQLYNAEFVKARQWLSRMRSAQEQACP